jgi:hypothetical protein
MPRIAASLGVVIVVAACIGFNTMRYPVVWDMVAVSHQLPQAGLALKPADSRATEASSADVKLPKAAVDRPRYVCTGDVCRLARADEAPEVSMPLIASAPSPAPRAQESAPAVATSPLTVKSDGLPEQPLRAEPQPAVGRLVPVARPDAAQSSAKLIGASQVKAAAPSQELASANGVRRLPPLDRIESSTSDDPESASEQQLPIYPTTTFRGAWQ